jgi:hypothetical protein
MRKINVALLGILAFFLCGCPYDSYYAPCEPGIKVDSSLCGKWMCSKNETNDTIRFELQVFNAQEYFIKLSLKRKLSFLRAFECKVKNVRILCFTEIGETPEYIFFAFRPSGKNLLVRYMSDKFVETKFKSSTEFYNFLEKNITQPALFEDEIVFERAP